MADERMLPRFQPRRQLGRTGFQATAEQMADVRQRAVRAIEGKGSVWWNP